MQETKAGLALHRAWPAPPAWCFNCMDPLGSPRGLPNKLTPLSPVQSGDAYVEPVQDSGLCIRDGRRPARSPLCRLH